MGLIDLQTDLKTLKYGSDEPYVTKDINNPQQSSGIVNQVDKRVDDLTRISKLLTDTPGVKFTANQAFLQQEGFSDKINKRKIEDGNSLGGAVLREVGQTAKKVSQVIGSTLAQVPVNGTGTHFVHGFRNDTYLQDSNQRSNFAQFFGAGGVEGAPLALRGEKIVEDGSPEQGLTAYKVNDTKKSNFDKQAQNQQDKKGFFTGNISKNTYYEKSTLNNPLVGQDKDYIKSNYSSKERQEVAKNGGQIIADNLNQEGYNQHGPAATSSIKDKQSVVGDLTQNTFYEKDTTEDQFAAQDKDYLNSNYSTKERQEIVKNGDTLLADNLNQEGYNQYGPAATSSLERKQSIFDTQDSNRERKQSPSTKLQDFRQQNTTTYSFDYSSKNINREQRVGLGNQGKKIQIDPEQLYTKTDPDTVDKINALGALDSKPSAEDSRDFISLNFQVLTPESTKFLYFRAYLDSFSDSFNADWSSTKYLGRAENMYTYNGFDRGVSLGFKIAASTREEMRPIYQKINYLASTTAPTYGEGTFMKGTLVKVTVGDYLYEVPAVINSVQYSWQTDYPWEISLSNPENEIDDDMQVLPHVLDCSVDLSIIHNFVPQTGDVPFVSNPFGNQFGKQIWTSFPTEAQGQVPTRNITDTGVGQAPSVASGLAGAPGTGPQF